MHTHERLCKVESLESRDLNGLGQQPKNISWLLSWEPKKTPQKKNKIMYKHVMVNLQKFPKEAK